jgi:hypothetical protein
MLDGSTLPRMVLRAVFALGEAGTPASLPTLLAVVPAPAEEIEAALRALDAQGFLDAARLRLTMRGLAAAVAPRMVAVDRRKTPRTHHWAGSIARAAKPGLRKVSVVA